jgi:hypothetical protein
MISDRPHGRSGAIARELLLRLQSQRNIFDRLSVSHFDIPPALLDRADEVIE